MWDNIRKKAEFLSTIFLVKTINERGDVCHTDHAYDTISCPSCRFVNFVFPSFGKDLTISMAEHTIPSRSAVPMADRWNAESVFATPAAWEVERAALEVAIPGLKDFQGTLAQGPEQLFTALDIAFRLQQRAEILLVYAAFAQAVDNADNDANAMVGQAGAIYGNLAATSAFLRPEILALGHDRVHDWTHQDHRLGAYHQYFDDLFRQQAHVRSAEVEEILGMVAEPLASVQQTANVLRDLEMPYRPATDSNGTSYEVSGNNIDTLIEQGDRDLRKSAWESYADAHLAMKGTLANNLAVAVKSDVFNARARNFATALEAALFANNIPRQVFDNLIATFKANLPTWHRYWAIRRRALGLDELHGYDTKVPLARKPPVIPFEQGVEMIVNGVRVLGDDYAAIVRRGCLEERWVDRYPNQGKFSNAFSYGTQGTYPFILTNYDNSLNDVSTLAHELGHSMHSYLTWHTQPFVTSNYSLFVAEVASNFHQAIVRDALFKSNPDPDFQLAVIDEAMNNIHRYFFIMPTLARLELDMHERIERGQGITADYLTGMTADLFAEAYGDALVMDRDRVGITWSEFGHLYANYYVYQYATGISAANALAVGVVSGDPEKARAYRAFLSAGSSLYPLDALKLAGVDMTTPEPVERAFGVLAGLVDRLDQLTR